MSKKTVGFIGLGIMGNSMAGHLLAGGHCINIFNRSKSKANDLISKGAVWFNSVGELAAKSDVIITMVGYPYDVEEVYLHSGNIIDNAKVGTYLIDMTTSSPSLARRIFESAAEKGCHALDAPVSGGDLGARNAKLSIMVGGDQDSFNEMLPIFQLMGSNIVLQGGPGAGQHTKMANQVIIASTIIGVCEGLSYAKKAGLDPDLVLQCIGGGAAGGFQLNNVGPKMLAGDFAPGFYVEHFLKDIKIALEESQKNSLELPGLDLAKRLYTGLMEAGYSKNGTQILFKKYNS